MPTNTQLDHQTEISYEKIELKPKKTKSILYCIVIFVILSITIFIIIDNFNLSTETETAIENVQNLKNMLKDPDSLKLYDDVLVIFYWDTNNRDNSGFYTYIDYGAKNSYGAMGREIAMFKGSKYIGTVAEAKEIMDDYEKMFDDDNLEIIKSYAPYLSFQVGSDKISDYEIVKKEKIMRKLK